MDHVSQVLELLPSETVLMTCTARRQAKRSTELLFERLKESSPHRKLMLIYLVNGWLTKPLIYFSTSFVYDALTVGCRNCAAVKGEE
jgi:hypothetical protein